MRDRLNAEGHDESQYLPNGMPPVNAFREQHGNVQWEGLSIRALTWMPDILFVRRSIEKVHLDTCVSFYGAVVETRKVLKIGDIRGILFDKPDELTTPKVDVFFNIVHGLCKPEANMLLWLVCDEYNRGNISLAHKLIGTIKHGIENAQKIIDNLRERAKQQESPSAELSLKSPRPENP